MKNKEYNKHKKAISKSPRKLIPLIAVIVVAILAAIAVSSNYYAGAKRQRMLSSYECMPVIANMDVASFAPDGEGFTFRSTDAMGNSIRFYGEKIALADGGIRMDLGGFICSLDSVGTIGLYVPVVQDEGYSETLIDWGGGYTFGKTSVDSYRELLMLDGFGAHAFFYVDGSADADLPYDLAPNYVYVRNGSSGDNGGGAFVLTELSVYYHSDVKTTPLGAVVFNTDFYGYHLEGATYDVGGEGDVDRENGIYNFYLMVAPETSEDFSALYRETGFYPITCPDAHQFVVGELRDSNGNAVDKATALIEAGMTLDITFGENTVAVELPTVPRFSGINTLSELIPYANADSLGQAEVLVVPVCWADETHRANDENLALYRKHLGSVSTVDGAVKDYSNPNDRQLSLSEYYNLASYGKFSVNAVMTDWYMIDEAFGETRDRAPDLEYGEKVLSWVKETYPNLDWTRFDRDGDGYVDHLLLINSGSIDLSQGYVVISMGGAIQYRESYDGAHAGTPQNPGVNTYVTVNQALLEQDGARILIHEFGHDFGIIDYYDVSYTGINAVGGYDMQSDNNGDWNSFSKYAVGWLEPKVVDLASGESIELTIMASSLAGDAIIIPAANSRTYDGTPFSEYILIDLFAPLGAHAFDADRYGLQDTTAVRIYHVNAMMELHLEDAEGGPYEIGTPHYANDYSKDGNYQVELIQSHGKNTFTDLEQLAPYLTGDDFFYVGDTFRVEDYPAFFRDGLMDEGVPFGYVVEIVSITEGDIPTATIRITAE